MDQAVFPDDVLPPEGIYESRESLFNTINSWAKPRGYAFTTGKSLKTPNDRVRVIFACDRNKPPPSASTERVRRTSSRRTGCKFSVLAKQSLDGSTWVLSHRPDDECAKHNHARSSDVNSAKYRIRYFFEPYTALDCLGISCTARYTVLHCIWAISYCNIISHGVQRAACRKHSTNPIE
jgi:hypothetical protein